ncbi:protein DpdH [Myxococcota bacterium]
MTVPQKPCWQRVNAHAVIRPDAEKIKDSVFSAVHTDFGVPLRTPTGKLAERTVAMEEFLENFLSRDRNHVQVAVLGESGAGKSHFIQWLRLAIPQDPSRRVITIPKAGTSLRGIIERLIDELPEDVQVEFQASLNTAGQSSLPRAGQFDSLLNNIALAVQHNERREEILSNAELADEVCECIPKMFYDVTLREDYWHQKGGVIEDLVNHVFSTPSEYRPATERREFTRSDLPLDGSWRRKVSDRKTLHALDLFLDEGDVGIDASIKVVNASLDTAIVRTLSFTGDRLINLMIHLRHYFHSKGQELVLLIEDLARLQGIDNALLQALIEAPDDDTCTVRWAAAVTTGYYRRLPDTVHTRMSYVVDMNIPQDESDQTGVGMEGLARMASRYLNAVRLGIDALETSELKGAPRVEGTRNYCDSCSEYREACHSTFGAVDGYGLFPFTRQALWNMSVRTKVFKDDRSFNPRALQNHVLKPILDEHHHDLELGRFPDGRLLDYMGGKTLSEHQEARIERSDSDFKRRICLLDLWDGRKLVVNLPEGIHQAFQLQPLPENVLDDSGDENAGAGDKPPGESQFITQSQFAAIELKLLELSKWRDNGSISQGLAQDVRDELHPLIVDAIDWDAYGWYKTSFTKYFKPGDISLLRQVTQRKVRLLHICLPIDEDDAAEFRRTVIALEALLKARQAGGFKFEGGAESLAYLMELVDKCAESLIEQIESNISGDKNWNPQLSSAQLMIISSQLNSTKAYEDGINEILERSFVAGTNTLQKDDSLQPLRKKLRGGREAAEEFLMSLIRGFKGGKGGQTFVDPRPILDAIKSLRQSAWTLDQSKPDSAPAFQQELVEAYTAAKDMLSTVVVEEYEWYRSTVEKIDAALGAEATVKEWKAALEAAETEASKLGLAIGRKRLNNRLSELRVQAAQEALVHARRIVAFEQSSEALPYMARERRSQLLALFAAVEEAETFLDDCEAKLEERKDTMSDAHKRSVQAQQDCVNALDRIVTCLEQLGGATDGTD